MSDKTPWTKGPWQWDCGIIPPDGPGTYADIYIDGGETIIAEFNNYIPEGKSNARLIAAAPAMAELLERVAANGTIILTPKGSADPTDDILALLTQIKERETK